MRIRTFKLGSFDCWSFQNEAVLFPVLFHLHVVLAPELWRECLVQRFSPADVKLIESSAMWTAEVDTGMVLSAGGTRDNSKSSISVLVLVVIHQIHAELVMSHLVLLGIPH